MTTTAPRRRDHATKLLEFTIPGSPGQAAVNNRYLNVPGVGRVKTPEAKAFDKRFSKLVVPLLNDDIRLVPLCNLLVRGYWPTRKRTGIEDLPDGYELAVGDADSPVKAVMDNLKTVGLYVDDGRVLSVVGSKHYDKKNPRIEVEVWADTLPAPEDKFHELERAVDDAHASLRRGFVVAFATMFDDVDHIVIAAEVVDPTPPDYGLDLIKAKATKVLLEDFGVRPLEVVLVRAGSLPKSPSAKLRRRATRDAWAGGLLERL